ncbi:MAG TPA: cytochrome c biogenesis protein CcsA [Vicinamibacterales bacterium]|jgi:heme exporter protein C|nr:cytochrome c biogenesis protein CcsA [Vicinamibacterales bacterium]
MRKLFNPFLALAAVIFVTAPVVIARAPFESTMGLVQKIFYYHMPAAMMMLLSAIFCGLVSAAFLATKRQVFDNFAVAAAELTVLYGAIAMVTGPLWARKAWGVWWVWDARLTMSLLMWMIFVSYLLLRRYGGPGSEKLSAGLAVFGMANAPFVYISVNVWRTLHPKTSVVPKLPVDFAIPLWWAFAGFLLLYIVLLTARARLEAQRALVDHLYLEFDE